MANEEAAEGSEKSEPWSWLAEKLSFRTVVVSACGLVLLGVALLLAAAAPEHHTFWTRVGTVGGEAFVASGLTTLILVLAFNSRIETRLAVRDALDDRMPTLTACADRSLAQIVEKLDVLHGGTAVQVLKREEIYPRSIELLKSMTEDDGRDVRILMSAEEDLAADRAAQDGAGNGKPNLIGEEGKKWLEELKNWVKRDQYGELRRVIAIPRDDFGEQFERARKFLLDPFANSKATQWFMRDDDFSISVMLLGRRFALFGFPEKSGTPAYVPFQLAVVIEDRSLVEWLDTWFDERFVNHADACKVMSKGIIDEQKLSGFFDRNADD